MLEEGTPVGFQCRVRAWGQPSCWWCWCSWAAAAEFTEFKYLGITLTRDGSMLTATKKMADNFRSAIARVFRIGDSKGIKQRKHAML